MRRRRYLLIAVPLLLVLLALLLHRPLLRLAGLGLPFGRSGEAALQLPPGFHAQVYAAGLLDPRFMALAPNGVPYVAERGAGRVVALPDEDRDGRADRAVVVAEGLERPSSLAFHAGQLYVGETTRVTRLELGPDGRVSGRQVVVPDLPGGGNHTTRTVLVSPDGQLYVSVGSSCNVCVEQDERRAAVLVYRLDGSGGRLYARGLRNAVGLAFNPWTGELWATNNGRDFLGDDRPPETVYRVTDGADYGWPRCHAGDLPDPDMPGGCAGVSAPLLELQAHTAPLGLAFYQQGPFPPQYHGLYIALHGSWNRSTPVGYEVVHVPLAQGQVAGPAQPFATGWLQPDGSSSGRPAGVLVAADGSLLVSDDKGGFIYRISWRGP